MLLFLPVFFPGCHKMSSNLLPIITQKDLESICLTKTGSGFALRAFHAPRNTDVSLKLLTRQNATERDLKALLEEVAGTQRIIQCKRLMPLLGICQFQGVLGIVSEWMHHGCLHALIHEHELYPQLPFPLCVRILSDVAEGLSYLHGLEQPILQHSLKPSNVLLDLEYRAKISDYGLATWRKQQIRSLLQNCNNQSCWDLLCLSPEILQGGNFLQEGDVYSFGMMCWEVLSRQKPFKNKKTLLEAVTGVCSGMRPRIEPEFIPQSLPHRNKLLHLIVLCWHQEPSYRPSAAECKALLQDVLITYRKEEISDAIYNLMHAKDCAVAAAKGPGSHVLGTDIHNLEVIYNENSSGPRKELNLKAQGLTNIRLENGTEKFSSDVSQPALLSNNPLDAALGKGVRLPVFQSSSKEPSPPPPSSVSTYLVPNPSVSGGSTLPFWKEAESRKQPPPPQFGQGPGHSPSYSKLQNNWTENTSTGHYSRQKSCSILACGRETILSCMTEGRLNHLLDVLRSQQLLSRMDYEMITSFPTLTGRARALLDTCLNLGEKASQTVVNVLSASKCTTLLQSLQMNAVN
uniref:Receptor-interacting serine/threonine-protein kinase 2-like n=1 Tax=Pogona vitticeps TaxID=103695 RepID=A0A6J0UMZ0_9SAUR